MKPDFDEKDAELLQKRQELYDNRQGPRVGDWCRMPNGELRRFTHNWGDGLQTTSPNFGLGSFYFDRSGFMSYSGALDPSVDLSKIEKTEEVKPAWIWFFHHDCAQAHNGVYREIPCRIYKVRD